MPPTSAIENARFHITNKPRVIPNGIRPLSSIIMRAQPSAAMSNTTPAVLSKPIQASTTPGLERTR